MKRITHKIKHPQRKIATSAILCLLALSACSKTTPPQSDTETETETTISEKFTDVTLQSGINYEQSKSESELGYGEAYFTGGAAAGDFNGDGWIDLYVTRYDDDDILYQNKGDGTFEDVTLASGISRGTHSNGAGWADIDNDGDLDLYVTTASNTLKERGYLYINKGDGTFVEEATSRSASAAVLQGQSVGFGDYNRDGWLDIIVDDWNYSNSKSHSVLMMNVSGTFTNISHLAPIDGLRSFTSAFIDLNNDQWPDLAISADFDDQTYLINNNGLNFSPSINSNITGENTNGMGAAFADYDNDGDIDWFMTGISLENSTGSQKGNQFYHNLQNNYFSEKAVELGISESGWAWGAAFIDFDNDGDMDLITTAGIDIPSKFWGDYDAPWRDNPIRFWINNDGAFTESSSRVGLTDRRQGKALITLDYDNDGDLDIFIVNNNDQPVLYRNDSTNNNDWIKIALQGSISNRDGIGAQVTLIYGENDSKQQYMEVMASGNFLGQNEKTLHFGLGEDTVNKQISSLEIKWPSGITQVMTNVSVNQSLLIIEPNTPSDTDNDGILFVNDNCPFTYNPNQENNDGDHLGDACDPDDDNDGLADEIESNTGLFISLIDTGTDPFNADTDGDGFSDKVETNSGTFISEDDPGTDPLNADTDGDGLLDFDEVRYFHLNPLIADPGKTFSAARYWNEELLDAIRTDYPAPTVHSRNLFHLSAAMWDAWAAYDNNADGYFITEKLNASDIEAARAETLSYAAYRLLKHRFVDSPGATNALASFDQRLAMLGYDAAITSTVGDSPAALGNRIAQTIIQFGLSDGANEQNHYIDNSGYAPVNSPMIVKLPGIGSAGLIDINRWQPLSLEYSIAQNGIPLPDNTQRFLGSHWGNVTPFALTRASSNDVYNDPGAPPILAGSGDQAFKDAILRVIRFSSYMDPNDVAYVDISPLSNGNNTLGSNDGNGRFINPKTNLPYMVQIKKRGDYHRILAEFWADGPDSETPPGHWNTLANYVSDHALTEKRLQGAGNLLSDLEWDIKLYFALNASLHDAAIATWDAKAKYDYVRPITAIRYMGGLGQSSDVNGPSYHENGLPLAFGLVEVITPATTMSIGKHHHLAGHEGEIAIRGWKGNPSAPHNSYSGVGWIRAVEWLPYQRETFVTPPFAGYTSGHSGFSRAAAEVLTTFTGDEFFPGGLGVFTAKKDDYLEFEIGPSEDIQLQWASYYDAADEAGLSRISGGIHVDADDLKGREIGAKAGIDAWLKALTYYNGSAH